MELTPIFASPHVSEANESLPCIPVLPGPRGEERELAGSSEGTSGPPIQASQRLSKMAGPLGMIQAKPLLSQKGKLRPREGKGFAQGCTRHEE